MSLPRLLLVDDHPVLARLVAAMLQPAFEVTSCDSARAAARAFDSDLAQFAVAVVDCQLPDVDGPSLVAYLRRHRPGLPIVFMSGDPRLLADVPPHASTTTLLKPFTPADLLERVGFVLGLADRA